MTGTKRRWHQIVHCVLMPEYGPEELNLVAPLDPRHAVYLNEADGYTLVVKGRDGRCRARRAATKAEVYAAFALQLQ